MFSVKVILPSLMAFSWAIPAPVLAQPTTPVPLPPLEPTALSSSGTNPEAGNPAIPPTAYTLAVGDRIFVGVMNVPEYSAEYQVQVDGTINLPVIGGVSIWGMTVQEVAQEITQRYTVEEVLNNPFITVNLLSASPVHVVIAGEVNHPGAYSLGIDSGKLPTVTQVIQQAGGITQQADLRQVQIIRPRRSGGDETLQVNIWEMLRHGDTRQDLTLRDGDSVVLADAPALAPADARLLGGTNLAPESIQVGIIGETQQAGTLQLPPNTPLNQAILAAGGFNRRARTSVELIRLNANGTITQRQIHVDFSQGIDEERNPLLQDRDVIRVRRNSLATIGDTLGTILSPAGQAFSLFGLLENLFPSTAP